MKLAHFAAVVLVALVGAAPTAQGFCWECNDCNIGCQEKAESCGEAGNTDCNLYAMACHMRCNLGRSCRCLSETD